MTTAQGASTTRFDSRTSNDAPSLARLTGVELRKMTDTRAGFWLLAGVVASVVATIVISCLTGSALDHTFRPMFYNTLQAVTVLLPIVGILLVSSEWTQRTTLSTFSLVPQRGRVMSAKLLAGVALSFVGLALCLVASAIGTAIAASGATDAWSIPVELLGQATIFVVTTTIIGIAFGAAFLASAPAIVAYFVAPITVAVLSHLHALRSVGHWVDSAAAFDPFALKVMTGTEWAHAGSALAIWMVAPLLIGLWRITQRDIG